MRDLDTLFASRSVPEHLVRGAVGLPLLVAAFVLVPSWGPLAMLLAVPAVVFLRGCPGCWAIGLSQTCELRDARRDGAREPDRQPVAR
ncbi:hypothetical protein GCM10011376_05210 [Nocardioides flavus (ex Wang et al. 2016)]|uniref:DUF4395 domain-containing protein n=1 Tax=Nocardioides flavus (ex Wang et al. 2016) TaxID=2058780 RepID=A0ABQ3HE96_9ACTN|nr:hypothetical protein [Nocardioides flavus (ex Wang et al. 2016)]GHE15706.1 hypothetical protein GCM10011376_05210 [Nocardioides flavus (ex Wang et al. 2016)]